MATNSALDCGLGVAERRADGAVACSSPSAFVVLEAASDDGLAEPMKIGARFQAKGSMAGAVAVRAAPSPPSLGAMDAT